MVCCTVDDLKLLRRCWSADLGGRGVCVCKAPLQGQKDQLIADDSKQTGSSRNNILHSFRAACQPGLVSQGQQASHQYQPCKANPVHQQL